jgi:protein involved in polysaccharide export with SLBB domain
MAAAGLCLVFLASAACRDTGPAVSPGLPLPETQAPQVEFPTKVLIGPGDILEVKHFYVPELNESQTVRPDGKISLQLVGEVAVQGKSPAEVHDELVTLYAPLVKKAEVTVFLRSSFNNRVYVGGEVNKAGAVDMPGPMTVLQAVVMAGGFNMLTAEVQNVVVIRHKDGKRYGAALNLKDVMAGKEVEPFMLEPNDIVYVPRTRIVRVDQWIDLYINRIVPQFGFFYGVPIGNGTTGIGTRVIGPGGF